MCVVMTAAMAAAIVFADPSATAALTAPAPAVEAPASVATEPLFADIVARAQTLKGTVDGWIAADAGADTALSTSAAFETFRADALALADLDMQGHVTLRDRGTDGDLKCILRGISEDMPKRLDAVTAAESAPERTSALTELSHLFEDNAEVILAPPAPEV